MSVYYDTIWPKLARPPVSALKQITGGRLNGMTDISPAWRIEVMSEQFGACGIGWKFTIDRLWTEPGTEGQVFIFAQVSVYIKDGEKWSDPVPGVGGNMLIEKERSGLHNSDEGPKMAVTDAIGTALKMLGVAADIYAGRFDTKYQRYKPEDNGAATPKSPAKPPVERPAWGGGAAKTEPPKTKTWAQMNEEERVADVFVRVKEIEEIAKSDKRLAQEQLKKLGTNTALSKFSEANQVKISEEIFRLQEELTAAIS